jgi:hypothetical protein
LNDKANIIPLSANAQKALRELRTHLALVNGAAMDLAREGIYLNFTFINQRHPEFRVPTVTQFDVSIWRETGAIEEHLG